MTTFLWKKWLKLPKQKQKNVGKSKHMVISEAGLRKALIFYKQAAYTLF